MNRSVWNVVGVVVLGLALITVVLGTYLVPSMAEAGERGTIAGWWLIWIVIGSVVASSIALAGFLFAAGAGKVPETRG
jgi:hypothetical protein